MAACEILHSSAIDLKKWDACVARNTNGLIYANSFYLNTMCEDWYGLVYKNYQLIFPIPYKKKYGIAYCYMPAFTQQLGFIGKEQLINNDITEAIQSFVKYASPYINFENRSFAIDNNCAIRSNFILNLNQPHTQLKKAYKKSIAYSLSKAAKQNLQYIESENINEAVGMYEDYNKNNMLHVSENDYKNLRKLLKLLLTQKQVIIRKIIDKNNETLSIVLLMKDTKRYYNIINTTTEKGRKLESNYYLYNSLFQELANQNMLFDFEGSDLPGVKKFYEKFGAINQPYFHWHYNKLPKIISWLKS